MGHIYIVGFPGTGKITVGKDLAERLSLPFCDSNEHITNLHGDLHELFAQKSEDEFRTLQHNTLTQISKAPQQVIAVGDTVSLNQQDWSLLSNSGTTIYLKRTAERLYWRLRHDRHIPSIQHVRELERKSLLETMLAQREPLYTQSSLTLECGHKEVWELAVAAKEFLSNHSPS